MCYDCDEYDEYDDYSDYMEEYWGDRDDDGIIGQSYVAYVAKAVNGHLTYIIGTLTRYEDEDWGQASGWETVVYRMDELTDEAKARCIEIGKTMQPGTKAQYFEPDETPTLPVIYDDIPF